MDDRELRELQEPTNWIDEEDAVRPPVNTPRVVISVAFSQSEFEAIERYARDRGMHATEFVRQATLDGINPERERQTNGTLHGAVEPILLH